MENKNNVKGLNIGINKETLNYIPLKQDLFDICFDEYNNGNIWTKLQALQHQNELFNIKTNYSTSTTYYDIIDAIYLDLFRFLCLQKLVLSIGTNIAYYEYLLQQYNQFIEQHILDLIILIIAIVLICTTMAAITILWLFSFENSQIKSAIYQSDIIIIIRHIDHDFGYEVFGEKKGGHGNPRVEINAVYDVNNNIEINKGNNIFIIGPNGVGNIVVSTTIFISFISFISIQVIMNGLIIIHH